MPGRTIRSLQERFWAKVLVVDDADSCWLWQGAKAKGYGVIRVLSPDGWINEGAHRVSYVLKHGSIPDNLHVLHHCDVRACVRPTHLYAGTHQDNMQDATDRDRWNPLCGDSSGSRRFPRKGGSLEQAREIRVLYSEGGHTYKEIGDWYGLTGRMVSYIIRGNSWPEST